jgi:NADH dehydrogenase
MREVHVVTGAFGYTGRYIARDLLAAGHAVRTLTTSPPAGPAAGGVEVFPLDFRDRAGLERALAGARVLYNTYWVRFQAGGFDQAQAVPNGRALFEAAGAAGVERVVHVSVANPSADSPFAYFRGKAELEAALQGTGLPHSILRPAVFFGGHDILINNIAWLLRRFPVFGVFGDGRYRLEPIHVEDFARLAVVEGRASGSRVIDAVGPESFEYRALVRTLADALGLRRRLVSIPPALGFAAAKVLGAVVGDVLLTKPEIDALLAGLLATGSPPAGTTRLSTWAREHAAELGRRYASELGRRRLASPAPRA